MPALGRQGGRGQPGRLLIAKSPVGHAGVEFLGRIRRPDDLVVVASNQHHRLPAKIALHGHRAEFSHLRRQQSPRQLTRQLEKRLRAALAAGRNTGLKTQPRRQMAGEQTHHQHGRKSHQVLQVADGKRHAWFDKKEIKCRHIQHRRQRSRPAAELQRHAHGGEQKQHHDIHQIEPVDQRHGQQGHQHAAPGGGEVADPARPGCATAR